MARRRDAVDAGVGEFAAPVMMQSSNTIAAVDSFASTVESIQFIALDPP
jgi:hypothetical protein